MNILVVGGDYELSLTLQKELTAKGHVVYFASLGESAIVLLRTEPIDVVLLDLDLDGEITGWDLLAQRAREPSLANKPIIAMTHLSASEVGQRRYVDTLRGAILLLSKPPDLDLLNDALGIT
jgi:DNA-binding response OmpR family regulator